MRGRALVGLLVVAMALPGSTAAGAEGGTGSLTGTVTGPSGEALRGVCVEAYSQEHRVTTTGADGTYRLDGLTPGQHLVGFNTCAEAVAGFAQEFYDNAAGFSDAVPVDVRAGTERTGIDAALEPAAVISGTVTDEESGKGLVDDCVVALEFEQGMFAFRRTAADGSYALANLRGGDYFVVFGDCSDPFTHVDEFYDDTPFGLPTGPVLGTEPSTVTVAQGEEADGIDGALAEGGSLVGTVTAKHTGRPASFVCAGLFPPLSDEPADVTATGFRPDGAPADGQYVFAGVAPGDYVVGFNPEQVCGDDGYDTPWADGASSREGADVKTVRKGEVTTVGDVVVSPRPSIRSACSFAISDGGSRFTDVSEDNVHARAIECVVERGVASGRADGSYGPAEPVRREQMATFVAGALRAVGVELPADPPDAFSDDDASVHERAIDQLAALGVVGGKGAGRYAPGDVVSRGQMAAFLVRAYELATGFSLLEPDDVFSDDDGTTHESSIDRAATAGLAAGAGDRAFRPGGDVRRDQMATFTARLLDRVQRDVGHGLFFFVGTGSSEETVEAAPGGAPFASLRRALADAAAARR